MNTWACKTSCQKGMNTFVPVATIDALRERIRCFEGGARHERTALPFGVDAIDERLPEGGLALGALHEVAGGGNGAIDGAAAALFAAGIAARTKGPSVVVRNPPGSVRPGASAGWTCAGPGDLCRGWRREVSAGVFRRSAALPQARRGRRGSCPPLNDSFAEATARRGRLGRDRPRTAALAPPSSSR